MHATTTKNHTEHCYSRVPSDIMASQACPEPVEVSEASHGATSDEESAPALQWQPTDTTTLLPANMPLPRVQRAWERKPLSPFSRQKTRVGKVWKRAAPVEIRNRRSLGIGSGKPVKKMRLDDGARVARWEGEGEDGEGALGSPARKIVLRKDSVGEEALAALADQDQDDGEVYDDAQDEEEEGTVEVFDDEGTLLDVGPDEVDGQAEWEDEGGFEPTMMHLGDMVEESNANASAGVTQAEQDNGLKTSDAITESERVHQEPTDIPAPADNSAAQGAQVDKPTAEDVAIPEGFVSPVKQSRPVPERRTKRKSFGSRRRTLPTEWRPSRLRQVTNMGDEDVEVFSEPAEAAPVAHLSPDEQLLVDAQNAEPPFKSTADHQWEDVEDEVPAELDTEMGDASEDQQAPDSDQSFSEEGARMMDTGGQQESTSPPVGNTEASTRKVSPTKLPSSPVPSIEGQHPRLPLRRSPRRKSSSPVKQSTIRSSTEHPHLVAFTPIKSLQRFSALAESPSSDEVSAEEEADDSAPQLLERSVSAPPEEPRVSPHRPSRPRVSDDTALLQAFLNRAAETKSSGRRISASKRESITNRRDSDVVRQALASPAKPEVLADLDPNSPSPRKTTTAAAPSDEIDDANILPEPEQSPVQKTRRSGRATRKAAPQTATPAATTPNKISIRGKSDGVVLNKTEAQETAHITRTNTRKNKGGAILPLYRLDKMQKQGVVDPLDDGTVEGEDSEPVPKPNSKGKALRWNETLVEFWQGGDVSETSLLSDELSAPTPAPAMSEKMDVEPEPSAPAPNALTAPPPAETPSKPKIRRLKATRTAAAPGKAGPGPAPSQPEIGQRTETAPKAEQAAAQSRAPSTTKRRSRIATPAKGLGNSSLLPTDLEPTPAPASAPTAAQPAQAQQQKKSIPTPTAGGGAGSKGRKAPPASKLPAPSSLSSSQTSNSHANSTTSSLGQGKENLTASPPKKKPVGPTSTKTFAPKLDFSKSLSASTQSSQDSSDGGVPGLASPAKKAGRRGVMFGPPPAMGNSASSLSQSASQEQEGSQREEVPMGLRSPAKRMRTRRGVVGGGGH